ncbi:MAG: protein translocase subunit SecD [Clostridiales Family XIII bacterium]|jgi:SecD/SecF fusion protein|nr:protein translocase subunit SecD [Clostridiales Family XIII bacterium]
MKKVLAIITGLLIVFLWIITLTDLGNIGPLNDKIKLGLDLSGGVYVVMEAQTDASGEKLSDLMKQTQLVIEERVNEMGLSEPVVTIEGEKRIRVDLPGAENAEEAIETIGKTAQLQFFMADGSFVLDGGQVEDAGVTIDQEHGGYAVTLSFSGEGAKAFEEATRRALSGTVASAMEGVRSGAIAIVLDGKIISAPQVNAVITNGDAIITGNYSENEAIEMALLIRAGALPVQLEEVNASEIAASLGIDALKMSLIAGAIGVALIFALMAVMYRVMGLAANLALLLYIPLIFWIMTLLGSVLTLPGIAGIILSVGMAVDANVIVFARIREEILSGKSVRVAVNSGFRRAMTTIIDSQVTTMIAGVVLYQFGSGPVRGFAMTLMIGIVISIFAVAVVTQLYLQLAAESGIFGRKAFFGVKEADEAVSHSGPRFSFIKNRKIYYLTTVGILLVGLCFGLVRGFNYGIDFTGGTMLQIDMGGQAAVSEVRDVLKENGVDDADIVYAGEGNREIIVRTTMALNSDARTALLNDFYETFGIDDSAVLSFEQFGPSVGDLLKQNAVKAVVIAAVCMLLYIIARFEWKFGVAALVGVAHDVLMLIAFYGIFSFPLNNPFIAGVLTVVGYSINDTIVIFDRIRENLKIMKKSKLESLIDTSINQTLARSLMTSATTVLVIIPLFILGGETIRQFTLPLMVGIAAGAASSIFICSPLYFEICSFLNKPKYRGKPGKKHKERDPGNKIVV